MQSAECRVQNAECRVQNGIALTLTLPSYIIYSNSGDKMKLKFTKMHGIGNDYIYFDAIHQKISDPERLALTLSDRRFGIGGDGVILICPSEVADAKMRMFNEDGSEGKMCGNGIRCVGKFIHDKGLVPQEKTTVTIETLSGIKTLELTVKDGKVQSAKVDMEQAILTPSDRKSVV